MLKILIADDEELARQKIRMFLGARNDISEIAEAANGYEALKIVEKLSPDIIFLDIEMPEMSGFEFLADAGKTGASVIFTTAYDRYAVRAFEVNAADYLLKPFTLERFNEALQRVTDRRKNPEIINPDEILRFLKENISKKSPFISRLTVRKGSRFIIIDVKDILMIEAEGNYLKIITAGASFLHRSTLTAFEESLDPEMFIRVHRSVIVKKDAVKELEPKFNNEFTLTLSNGLKTTSSRNYYSAIKTLLP